MRDALLVAGSCITHQWHFIHWDTHSDVAIQDTIIAVESMPLGRFGELKA